MCTILQRNGPETDYSRCLAQHNPNLKEKLGVRQDTLRTTGTTFPISVQDKEVNVLLDTGAEKS